MILEKLNKKVNPKKNIYLSSWILKVDKITGQSRQFLGLKGIPEDRWTRCQLSHIPDQQGP